MNLIIRQVMRAVFFSLFISVVVIGTTFIAFPLDNWTVLLERKIEGIPFLVLVVITPIVAGTVIGVANGWYWRQRLHVLDRQLAELVKEQKFVSDEEPYKELTELQKHMEQIQQNFRIQAENKQKLATERANEREKSLQEVVIQERNRLARELHDSVSQQLFAVSMLMAAINESGGSQNGKLQNQLQLVEKMINQSQLEMRALLLHLRPVALKGKSLQEGIKELLVELTQKVPMEIDWKIETFTIAKGIEDQLFRILQESVSNTLRHAKATTFSVLLIERDDTIILRVMDNGIGFDVEQARASSYGLQNMSERAYEVGGTLKIVSLPNQGTRLEVKVPRLKNEDESDD
ncbi:sensor histidine kinase [Virgibacillus dakarensis]|uniref:Sensor histidine kinase n=1 Tax=Lentibacillus populi TaxID=1827502 RepID=A0A9W5TW03_9BACI|nr:MULTISPECIES: sensor histidine kinase [Bacillaceae]MBT2217627.1 sensor histidine kinase [Virgibacillus dakarensis]MTW84746.1 sensor histidine kinase [Virgibacillus dakarensis]GGB36136.1 sensor histidine kinase [Lentibacillus populi]